LTGTLHADAQQLTDDFVHSFPLLANLLREGYSRTFLEKLNLLQSFNDY
jgi:hypothetical protein